VNLADKLERVGHALNADDLAELLSVSKVMIYKLASEGKIPSFRIGMSLRFDPHCVANWLRERRVA
jgi:excisionase family DNA binding protein